MKKFTRESIVLALREEVCQGQEGHATENFHPIESEFTGYVLFTCKKCRSRVAIAEFSLVEEELEAEPELVFGGLFAHVGKE